jgi:hypothetical protein
MALGKVWQYKVLCFGLKTAPHLFTRTVEPLAVWARGQGIHIHVYLDDWLILAEDEETLKLQTQRVLVKAQELGWLVNRKKSSLIPSRQFAFLGMQINTLNNTVQPVQKRVDKLAQAVENLLTKIHTTPRKLQSLIGCMVSVADLVPYAKLERRPLQFVLSKVWDRDLRSLDRTLTVSSKMRDAVHWWSDPQNVLSSVSIQDLRKTITILTDASQQGWGAHLEDRLASGRWSPEQAQYHINVLEMWAVEKALVEFQSLLLGQRVQILSDNMTVVSYISKQGGTLSFSLYQEVRRLLLWCKDKEITLLARHIPGKRNVLADRLSRPGLAVSTEWKLDPLVFRAVTQQTWYPLTDLFATRWNNQVPQFISPFPDTKALDTDALSLNWDKIDRPYLFPPTPIIKQCLEKIEESTNSFLAVLPLWPNKVWFPLLLRLMIDYPIKLPVNENLLTQGLGPRSLKRHTCPDTLKLAAWILSGNPWLREAFQVRLRKEQHCLKRNQPLNTMSTFGRNMWAGWTAEGHPIPLRPLSRS